MTFEVKFNVIDENDDEKYNGYVTVNMAHVNIPKIRWIISDCEHYPSSDWVGLLNYMKGLSSTCSEIGGGGKSNWSITVVESTVVMEFDICGDSNIVLSFTFQQMIPIVEEIINNIKKME
jgi:hypothetical protein